MGKNKASVLYLSPDTLHGNRAFSQAVVTEGPVKTVYVGGQNAVTPEGEITGKGDLRVQAQQVFRNLKAALDAGGAGLEHVIKWSVYVVEGHDSKPAFEVFREAMGSMPHPPLISVLQVCGLAHPDFLMELEAIAVVPV